MSTVTKAQISPRIFGQSERFLANRKSQVSAIDPIDARLFVGWRGGVVDYYSPFSPSPYPSVSSHIDASTLFNCSSDNTRPRRHFGPAFKHVFSLCSFPGRMPGSPRGSGPAVTRCLVYTTTITGYLVPDHPAGTKTLGKSGTGRAGERVGRGNEGERKDIDPRGEGPRQRGAVIFSSSGNAPGISLVIKSHRPV